MQCVVKSTSQIKGKKKEKKKRTNDENNSCEKPLWADECPFDAGMPFPASKPRRSQRCTLHPNKRRIRFSEGLALPLQPCSVSLRACCEPATARRSCQVTDSTDSSSLCGSGTHRARRSGTEDFAGQQATEGTEPAEQRYCILEARALSYNEDERKQAEERHAMSTGAVLCRGKERGLKPRRLMSLASC